MPPDFARSLRAHEAERQSHLRERYARKGKRSSSQGVRGFRVEDGLASSPQADGFIPLAACAAVMELSKAEVFRLARIGALSSVLRGRKLLVQPAIISGPGIPEKEATGAE